MIQKHDFSKNENHVSVSAMETKSPVEYVILHDYSLTKRGERYHKNPTILRLQD